MRKVFLTSVFVLTLVFGSFLAMTSITGAAYGDVTTFASIPYWGDGQDARNAYLDFPDGMTRDSAGNIYIADTYNNSIRKIATNNRIYTLAGNGSYGFADGKGGGAQFAMPSGITVDHNGNVYVADTYNHRIRKISPDGTTRTIVDKDLYLPKDIFVDGSTLYIADTGHGAIKTVSTDGGTATVFKDGFSGPEGVLSAADWVYISDTGHNKVVKVNKSSKAQHNVVASGLNSPKGLAKETSYLYIADDKNDAVKRVNLKNNQVTTFASDTTMTSINFPRSLFVAGDYVYVLNSGIGTIQRFNKNTGATTIPADRTAGADRFGYRNGSDGENTILGRPYVMAKYGQNNLYVAENNKIRLINISSGASSDVIGNSVDNYKESTGSDARFSTIQGMAVSSDGQWLYVSDRFNNRIRKVHISSQTSYWVSGTGAVNTTGPTNGYQEGAASSAKFNNPTGVVLSPDGQTLFVADTGNNRIRAVRLSDGFTSLVAGTGQAGYTDGVGGASKFNKPVGITIDASGRYLYVADTNNHRIRSIDLRTGIVRSIAGSGAAGYRDGIGSQAYFSYPEYVTMASDGKLYVSEVGGHKIRWVDPSNGDTRLVAGSGDRGYKNGSRFVAQFNNPKGIVTEVNKNRIFVADTWNDTIRRVTVTPNSAPHSEPGPGVTACVPSIKIHDTNLANTYIKIIGGEFRHGAKAYFNSVEATTYVINDHEIVAKIPFGSMEKGWYNIRVVNLDGQVGIKNMGFGIADNNGNVPNVYPGGTDMTVEPAARGFSFYAYPKSLRGGFFVGAGDVQGNGMEEVLAGTGAGFGPQVMIYDKLGNKKASFFAYAKHLRSGVRVAAGNVDGSGKEEIIVGPGAGGRPHIRIFDGDGNLKYPGFFALDGKFMGGVWVDSGDVNGDGVDEILVSAAKGGGPQVTIHKKDGTVIGNFFAYDPGYRNGVRVAAVDVDGDGVSEIVTAPDMTGKAPVRVFTVAGKKLSEFYPFGENFQGGISVAGGNTNRILGEEIIVAAGYTGGPMVRAVDSQGNSVTANFWMYRSDFRGGVMVGAGDVDGNGVDEILGSPAGAGGSNFRIVDPNNLE